MANTWQVADWLTMEGLRLLINKLEVAPWFDTSYNKEFTREFAVGETVRVPLPQRFTVRTGLGYSPQAINRIYTEVTVDQVFGIDFEWDDVEKALRVTRPDAQLKEQVLKPAVEQLKQEIDSRCALFAYQNANNAVGVLGTDPTSFDATSAAARQRLIENACPPGEKGMIVPPAVVRSVKNAAISYFNPTSDISKQYREGSIGKADGFDWYESMSLWTHTAGTWAGAVTCNTTLTDGATSMIVNCTSGDTFKKGDIIGLGGIYFVNPMTRRTTTTATTATIVVTADVTATASTATITFQPALYGPLSVYQNVSALPIATTTALTLFPATTSPNGKSGKQGLALYKDAFALVGVNIELPKAVEMSSRQRDPNSGISFRFVKAWDPIQSKMIHRFDVVLGFGRLYSHNCAVRVLAAA